MKIIPKLQLKLILLSLAVNAFWAKAVSAQMNPLDRLKNTADKVGYSTANVSPQEVVGQIIMMVLGFVGIIFLAMIIYSGFQMITSGGNEVKITSAKKRLLYSIIGLAIILASYAISWYVIRMMTKATTSGYYSFQ